MCIRDRMKDVAKVGYFMRCAAMTHALYKVVVDSMRLTNRLMKDDKISLPKRLWLCLKGSWWVYGPKGIFARNTLKLLDYYRPGFHPWQHQVIHSYPVWIKAFEESGNPMKAGDALFQAAY